MSKTMMPHIAKQDCPLKALTLGAISLKSTNAAL